MTYVMATVVYRYGISIQSQIFYNAVYFLINHLEIPFMLHRIERPIVSRLMRFDRAGLTTTPNNQLVQAHPKLEKVIKEMYKHTIPRLIVGDSWGDVAMINNRESQLREQVAKGQDPIDALREMYRRQPPTADWEKLVDDVAKVVADKHESIFSETLHATKERKEGEELLQGLHKAAPLARQILADLEADKTGAYQIVSSALHKNDDYITIGIDAVDYIDFKSIDNRIEQTSGWMKRYPMGTNITIPAQHSEEIINKLKEHRGIASIGRELTACGIDVQKKMRASYATRADDLKLLKSTATTSQLGMFSSNNVPPFVVGEGYKPPKNSPVNHDTASNCTIS